MDAKAQGLEKSQEQIVKEVLKTQRVVRENCENVVVLVQEMKKVQNYLGQNHEAMGHFAHALGEVRDFAPKMELEMQNLNQRLFTQENCIPTLNNKVDHLGLAAAEQQKMGCSSPHNSMPRCQSFQRNLWHT